MSQTIPINPDELRAAIQHGAIEWGAPEDQAEILAQQVVGLFRQAAGDTRPQPLFKPDEIRFGRFMESDPPDRRYLLRDVLPLGVVGLVGAQGGAGKSLWAYQLGFAVATGSRFLGIEVDEPGSFLYLASEDDEPELHRRGLRLLQHYQRLAEMARQPFDPALVAERILIVPRVGKDNLLTRSSIEGEISRTEMVGRLIEAARQIPDLRCIVLDPLSRFRGGNGNVEEDATRFVEALEAIKEGTGATVLGLHHINKTGVSEGGGQEILRGSSALVDGVRWVATLQKPHPSKATEYQLPEEELARYLRLDVPKSNYTAPFPGMWLRREDGGVLVPAEDPDPKHQTVHDQVLRFVRHNPGCSTRAVEGAVSGRVEKTREAITELIGSGELVDDGGSRGRALRITGIGSGPKSRKSLSSKGGRSRDAVETPFSGKTEPFGRAS